MAYQTTTPASVSALVSQIIAFAVANANMTDATGSPAGSNGGYTQHALQTPSGAYITLAYNSTEILANTSTAWSKNTALVSQTGAHSLNARYRTTATPVKAWMFADGYSCHVVINPTAGAYHHLSFGRLEKFGTYTGGEYVAASYLPSATFLNSTWIMPHYWKNNGTPSYNNSVRVTYGGLQVAAQGYIGASDANNFNCGFAGTSGAGQAGATLYGDPLWRQPNSYNGRAVIMPPQYFLAYDKLSAITPEGWIPIGQVSNCGYINMENINPEDVTNDDWVVFPLCMKNPVNPILANYEVDTQNIGLAYKK